ncbi:hypothetical protein D3879_11025 [Pseudomonas cavernicola]|uniref:YqjK-like protein n=1 Tax=Pseudomonas cavernicola TaxID=2320866 RepID=A0A418XMQ9_9PSED|nr:hypothetical protein [Pseudomonas cavernicola]RJG13735.1 hypothetical protein D3879_11025 [Pseudomonas cavernicola]
MSLPLVPPNASRRELRKALIRMRLEMHRQELRHESLLIMQPLQHVHGMTQNLRQTLGFKHAPLWGMAGIALLGFFGAKRGHLSRWLRLGITLYPLLAVALRRPPNPPNDTPS